MKLPTLLSILGLVAISIAFPAPQESAAESATSTSEYTGSCATDSAAVDDETCTYIDGRSFPPDANNQDYWCVNLDSDDVDVLEEIWEQKKTGMTLAIDAGRKQDPPNEGWLFDLANKTLPGVGDLKIDVSLLSIRGTCSWHPSVKGL